MIYSGWRIARGVIARSMPIRTILIIDPELGFVFWLGQALDKAGYQALPAKNCEDAGELLKLLKVEIHLLIIGHAVAGARVFAETLRQSQGHLKVIAVVGDEDEPAASFPEANASRVMLSGIDETSETEWLATIDDVFSVT